MDDKVFSMSSRVCRICPSEEFLLELYNPSNAENRNVLNLFIDVEDENTTKLPKFICKDCKHKLESIIEFRDSCKTRDNELRAKIQHLELSMPIKIEEPTENDPIEEVTIKEEAEFLVEFLDDKLDDTKEDTPLQKKDHRKKTENPCNFCDKVFPTWSELNDHKKADHLQCPVCLKSFPSFRKMSHHKDNNHAGDTSCHLCGVNIKKRYLPGHIRKIHNEERNFKCEICGKEFFRPFDLKTHLSTHNETNSEICDFENCGKAFKNVVNLKAHKKTHDPVQQSETTSLTKTIVCQCCGKILKSTTGYTIHMRIHRNERPFECKTCNKTFYDFCTLTKHERSHTNIRPYQCDQCPMQFKTKCNLNGHKINIHETEMKHECHICGKRTKMKSNLTLHMKTHGIGKHKDDAK